MMRVISFNVHGTKKLVKFPRLLEFLCSAGAICLQETLDESDLFCVGGFAKYSSPAVRINGQPSGGLATFVSHEVFGGCKQTRIHSLFDWVLPVFITDNQASSLLLINVYIPR